MPASRAGDLFDRLARRYDRGNRIMSLAQDLRWKRRAAREMAGAGLVLDLGAGTGDLARLVRAQEPHSRVLSIDASQGMLRAGRVQDAIVADAQQLPVRGTAADGAVSGFLLRNLPDLPRFFAAAFQALRPGARLAILDISYPSGWRRAAFSVWFHGVGPLAAGAATGQFASYRYLSRSLAGFPTPSQLGVLGAQAGFKLLRLEVSPWTGVFLLVLQRPLDATAKSKSPR